MDDQTLSAVVEAIVLTAGGPVSAAAIAEAIGEGELFSTEVERHLEMLRDRWGSADRGVRLEKIAGHWRSVTPPELDSYLQSFHGIVRRQRLSQAALEVLSIVAHRQPVTLPEVNFIRGTNSAGVLRTLLDRKLVRMAGRKQVVGKPFLYRTTREFLLHFGLDRVEDLPDPAELVKDASVAVD